VSEEALANAKYTANSTANQANYGVARTHSESWRLSSEDRTVTMTVVTNSPEFGISWDISKVRTTLGYELIPPLINSAFGI